MRKSNTQEIVDVTLNEAEIKIAGENLNELTLLKNSDLTNVNAMALKLDYSGPTDVDALEALCASRIAQTQQSIFELGASLLLLRESCLHGDWSARLNRIGVNRVSAHRYMTIALKFSGGEEQRAMKKLGMGKVLEMVTMEDEDVAALISGETVQGLQLDEIEKMTTRELRAKLREAKQTDEAKDQLLADKNARIDALAAAKKFKPRADSIAKTEAEEDAMRELAEALAGCEVTFARLRNVAQALAVHDGAHVRERASAGVRYMIAYVKNTVLESELPDLLDVAVDDEALLGRPAWMDEGMNSARVDAS